MAISASAVWECRGTVLNGSPGPGNDNNGGAFKAGAAGTDRSQQNAAQVVIDNSTITTSITANVITFTGYVPTSADVGNYVQMLTGTNVTQGWYEITAQTATTWTVTGTVNLPTSGTTTNATGNMGGALATMGKLSGAMVGSNKAFLTGAFTSTASIVFAQAVTPSGSAPATRLTGYGTARGDSGHATLTLQTNTGLTAINNTGSGLMVEQLDVNCAGLGTSTGFVFGNFSQIRNCLISNFTTAGITTAAARVSVTDCELTGGTAAATGAINAPVAVMVSRCFVHDNTCPGVIVSASSVVALCEIANNSGASSDGLRVDFGCFIHNNTIHNNGRHGIQNVGTLMVTMLWRNNLLTNNGGFGIVGTSGTALPADPSYDGNAFFGNTSGTRSNMDSTAGIFGVSPYTNVRDVFPSISPYVGPTTGAGANFALNNTAGGGAACRNVGSPGTWPGNTGSTGYEDMGAVHHQGDLRRQVGMVGGMTS